MLDRRFILAVDQYQQASSRGNEGLQCATGRAVAPEMLRPGLEILDAVAQCDSDFLRAIELRGARSEGFAAGSARLHLSLRPAP